MKRRTVIGLAVAGAIGVVSAGAAVAFGSGGAGFRHGIMKRMVAAAIDEALDGAQVTPEQRARIHAVRDRVFATVETQRTSRHAHLEEALRLFESDRPDPAALEALHRTAEAERAQVRQAVHDALVEVHGILTPDQRRAIADYVRAHRMAHAH
jgi:Spy/CpxP family protein refolding chaperone